jgi:methyl-accepting chemotaxis protein
MTQRRQRQRLPKQESAIMQSSGAFSFFNNIKIAMKIGIGFGLVLLLFAVVAVTNYSSLRKVEGSLGVYTQQVEVMDLARDFQNDFGSLRRIVRDFIFRGEEKSLERYEETHHEVERMIALGLKEIHNPERHARMVEIEKDYNVYNAGVAKLFADRRELSKLAAEVLDPTGAKIRLAFDELEKEVYKAGNTDLFFQVNEANKQILRIRIHTNKLLGRHSESAEKKLKEATTIVEPLLNKIKESTVGTPFEKKSEEATTQSKKYLSTSLSALDLTTRLDTQTTEMSKIGIRIGDNADAIVESTKADEQKTAEAMNETAESATRLTEILAGGGFILGALFAWLISRGISTPIVGMTGAMQSLASGKTNISIPGVGRGDEVGAMAETLQVFKNNLEETERMREEQVRAKERAEQQRKADLQQLASQFEQAVGSIISIVASASTELSATAESLTGTARATSDRSASVAAASEQASANVQTVASAAEELTCSVREISSQVQQSSNMTSKASVEAGRTSEQIHDLAKAAERIGGIIDLINNVASQTNLLALNATIEAARAGEAGRGFAVVAQEVKQLAEQTAKATAEISDQITGIQNSTKEAIARIEGITKTINEVDSIAASIASSVEEQGSATQEIARNVHQASLGTQEVAKNITGVQTSAESSSAASSQVLSAARDLSQQAEALQVEMNKFLDRVRAA